MNLQLTDQQVNDWYLNINQQAIGKNLESTNNWSRYKSDTEVTKSNLQWLPEKLSHQVLVPVGPRAYMKGKIVHTNEVLVNLGDNWLAKRTCPQARDICDRRIKYCDDNLQRLAVERNLFEQRQSLPLQQDAFGSIERPEITEEVTEEEHETWKREHRLKEKEYRRQLAQLRSKEKKVVESEEDVWKRLEELELIEELEDELNRLNESCDDEEEVSEEECLDENEQITEEERVDGKSKELKRRVSFANDDATENQTLDEENDEPLRLEITHTSTPPCQNHSDIINSPGDIYKQYKEKLSRKSILKSNVNPNQEYETSIIRNLKEEDENEEKEVKIGEGIRIPDVFQKSVDLNVKHKDENKKISKFKMSRMKKI